MKKLFLLIILALAGVFTYYFLYSKKNKPGDETPKQAPVTVSKYSATFNRSISEVLDAYYSLTESLVKWDNAGINAKAATLKAKVDKIQFDEIKQDTIIHQTAVSYVEGFNADLGILVENPDITAKRHAFHTFSQNFYDLLRTVKYDGGAVFLQECPMAFNDTEPGIWLSNETEIRNPYLGTQHPKYKSGMINCGETKDSLTFRAQ